jgi:hypothetical protein
LFARQRLFFSIIPVERSGSMSNRRQLGIIAVLGIVVGIAWSILWNILAPTPRPHPEPRPALAVENPNREAMQANFNMVLFAASKPCATKTKPKSTSDVTNCSLFGLRLGMSLDEAKKIIDGSGYFPRNTYLLGTPSCDYKDCAGKIYQKREGLTVSVEFGRVSPEDKTQLFAKEITLIFDPGGNPYFDSESLRATFIQMMGPPDTVSGEHQSWGDSNGAGATARAYPYDGRYWVIIERPDR